MCDKCSIRSPRSAEELRQAAQDLQEKKQKKYEETETKMELTSKKEKRVKNVERTLVTWAVGFIIIILGMLLRGDYLISAQELFRIVFHLLVCQVILMMVRRYAKEKTGELHEPVPYGNG